MSEGMDVIVRSDSPTTLRVVAAPDAPNATGRVRHDHKITVYVSDDELHALEQARLDLARQHGVRVDRGRLVREAIAEAVADFEGRGARSTLVRRLHGP